VGLVTVSRVKVSPDLSLARVYWTLLGDAAERKKTTKALQRAAPFVRHVLASRVSLRRVPEVAFQFDEGLAAHARVEEILHELHEEAVARGEPPLDSAAAVESAEPAAVESAESTDSPVPDDPDHTS
jgi:ribosome-binding factor A